MLIGFVAAVALGGWLLWIGGNALYRYVATHQIVTREALAELHMQWERAELERARLENENSTLFYQSRELAEKVAEATESLRKATAAPSSVVDQAIAAVLGGRL